METSRLTRLARLTTLLLLLVVLAACNARKDVPPEGKGSVQATGAFLDLFGPTPSVDKGTGYAFVIYFPSAKEPGKVLPFPFFSFDEASLKKVALGKLVAGVGDLPAYSGEIAQPFPSGTRVLDIAQSGDTVTVNFSKELAAAQLDAKAEQSLISAVVLTLRQFPGVARVILEVDGADSPLNKLTASADGKGVIPLPPPRLLSVTGMKEKGATKIEEMDAFFDRPVDIKELTLSVADGKKIEGEMFQSVFDMAGVLKAKDPQPYPSGTTIKVHWKVVDKLGRAASGDADVPLEIKEH